MPRISLILAVLALTLIPQAQALAAYTPADLLAATNQARITNHLTPLALNPQLEAAAKTFASNEAQTGDFSHNGVWPTLVQTRYEYAYAGQNLARQDFGNYLYTDPQFIVNLWLNSPSHRMNLLSDTYTETGLAIESSPSGQTYVVQYFGKPLKSSPNAF